MRNFPVLKGQVQRELDAFQQMEQRVYQLEALVQEMRLEIEFLRTAVHPDNQRRLEKMQAYQRQFDQMFGLLESA